MRFGLFAWSAWFIESMVKPAAGKFFIVFCNVLGDGDSMIYEIICHIWC